MFSKSFRLKSNNALKNSEKKHLAQRIQNAFPTTTEDMTKELLPYKSAASCSKIVTHAGDTVVVYSIENVPVIIEAFDRLFPTVCALWKVPDLVPTITVVGVIVPKLQGGAPLYLPGVQIPPKGAGFPQFSVGQVIAVNSDDNKAPMLVGSALMSSSDMLFKTGGVCLETMHVLGDFLCKDSKFGKIERPSLGPASYSAGSTGGFIVTTNLSELSIKPKVKEEWPSLGAPRRERPTVLAPETKEISKTIAETNESLTRNEPTVEDLEEMKQEEENENGTDDLISNNNNIPEDMDGLLKFCLLSFLKMEGKKITFPLKTNLLYRNHMAPLCPNGRALDVKKSSYKKLGKFMDAMQTEGILVCKEIEKGVDAVVGVELTHPNVRAHVVPGLVMQQVEEASRVVRDDGSRAAPHIKEMYSVTANVVDVLTPLRKGSTLTSAEVRARLTDYVKRNNLQDPNNRGLVNLNPSLSKIVGSPGAAVSWEQLMSAVLGKMTACTEMAFTDGSTRSSKGKLEPVRMQVATRSGNKKVTLVSNLELYGINLSVMSKECQHGLSVASSVTRSPGSKYDQLLVQGDQAFFITNHLMTKYGLAKRYIDGADKALKKKR